MSDAGMKAIRGILRSARADLTGAGMVPFIRAFPSGEKRLQQIKRPDDIYALACKFIAHGGRYLVFINERAEAELVAALVTNPAADEEPDLIAAATETVPNGPELIDAVDRLIRTSIEKLDSLQ